MSWYSRGTNSATGLTAWATGQIPAGTDFNSWGLDVRTWGDDVNAGSHSLTNCTSVVGTGGIVVSLAPSGGGISVTNHLGFLDGVGSLWLGYQAAAAITTANYCTLVGQQAGAAITIAGENTAFGYQVLNLLSGGSGQNDGFGTQVMATITTGACNVAMGAGVMGQSGNFGGAAASYNTMLGNHAGYKLAGNRNVGVGVQALFNSIDGNVALGYYAGHYELGSNQFYVTNVDQGGNDRSASLLWGTFSGSAGVIAGQQLTINGVVTAAAGVTNGPILQITTSGTGGGLGIYSSNTSAGTINWGMVANWINNGDFAIVKSAAMGGNPFGNINPTLYVNPGGNVGIATHLPTSILHVVGLGTYASDAAAGAAGLTTGAFYQDSSGGLHVKL